MLIRRYRPDDFAAIAEIHDRARMQELTYAGLTKAFLPLHIAAEREGLLDYPGLFVAELEGVPVGFTACSEEELAWLYVDPAHLRRGIGRALVLHALEAFPQIQTVEVLKGNEPARALYRSLGFLSERILHGVMPGNESFAVEVWELTRIKE